MLADRCVLSGLAEPVAVLLGQQGCGEGAAEAGIPPAAKDLHLHRLDYAPLLKSILVSKGLRQHKKPAFICIRKPARSCILPIS